MRRILLGSDGSTRARHAEDYAIAAAHADGGSVIALHVVDTDLMHYARVDHLATQGDKDNFLQYVKEQGEQECRVRLGGVVKKAREKGVEARLHVRWGEPLREVLTAASESGADEIILPSHSWGMDFNVPCLMARMNRSSRCKITILP